ncbi:aldo/keto reductase [Marinihelvus fidelis]|uniref:Aldo/keto reductase n=1 Tax=Marinihelvus fidelis TaxID=2613842 RepID=A0A5N0TFI4_9GAMM|nr:aldo/keto reductase [Marinihelvus fidelis]KAA9132636.1 aldo/keto reductase [Marinihelvus fidelis]
MKQRTLGKSDILVSEAGLGCWQLGGDFGPVEGERAEAVLRAALEAGIDFWDTADVYGAGLSESRIGEFVRKHAADVTIATKVGRDGELYPTGYTRRKVRASIEGSARRLGVEAVDLVQLHCVPPEVLYDGDLLAWMEDFQRDGLVRAFGASVETLEEAKFACTHPDLASLQIIFNLFRQDAITELFPLAMEKNVGIIVRLPLASGVLAGKMHAGQTFADTDHRQYNRNGEAFSQGETFSGLPFETAVELADALKPLVPEGMDLAQMAMRWILDHPAVTTVIAGASRPDQVTRNAAASDLPALGEALHAELAAFYHQRVREQIRVPV